MMIVKHDNETMMITSYGKSMYGGWYANYLKNDQPDGTHARTLIDLCNKLHTTKSALLKGVLRTDN